jgi:hypothetical protein
LGAQERASITVYEGDDLYELVYPPYKEGFEFLGWSSDPELFVSYELDTPVTSDLTLYAVWSGSLDTAPGKHRLTVHLQGGAFRNVPLQVLGIDFTEGQTLSRLPRVNGAPDHSTLTFASWNTQADGRGRIIWNDTPLTEDIDIYAIYGELIQSWEGLKTIECGKPDAVYVLRHDPKYNPGIYATCPTLGPFVGFNRAWVPLCQSPSNPFKGQMYGPAQICYTANDTEDYAGFFAHMDGAVIANVGFSSIEIYGAEYMGGIAAEMKNSRLERVSLGQVAFNDNRTNNIYSGGFIGYGDNLTITDVSITFAGTPDRINGKYAGGIAGYLSDSYIDNTSNSSLRVSASKADAYVGGYVGYMSGGKLNYSVAGGNLRVVSDYARSYVGAQVGYAKDAELSALTTPYSTTYKVNVNLNGEDSFGGLAVGAMENSSLQGAIIYYGVVSADFGDRTAVGGIAGKVIGGSVKETLIFMDNITAAGDYAKAGGIAGENYGGEIANNLVVGKKMPVSKAVASFIKVSGAGASAGPVVGAAPADLGTNNHIRSGILINNSPYPGREFKAFRGSRGFFDATLAWDFANNNVWEMHEYYDFPTFKAEHAEAFIPIYTEAEFLAISGSDVASVSNNSPTLSKKYVLMNSLDLSAYTDRKPIGCVTNISTGNMACASFSGTFFGGNKTIYGLNGGSLFYNVGNAAIRSLNISGASTTGSVLVETNVLNNTVIEDVHVTGSTVSLGTAAGGGLLHTISNSGVALIENSFEGSVSGGTVGGIVYSVAGTEQYLYKNYTSGTISGTTRVGGIAGTSAATVEDCYSDAIINTSTANAYAGGIVGALSANGRIFNSHFVGSVNANPSSTGRAGGIAGDMAANTEISSSLSLAKNIVNGQYYGRITGYRANTTTSVLNNNHGLLLTTSGVTLQDPDNDGDDVPGDAIDTAFFGTYLPDWDLANTWYIYDGALYPTLRY